MCAAESWNIDVKMYSLCKNSLQVSTDFLGMSAHCQPSVNGKERVIFRSAMYSCLATHQYTSCLCHSWVQLGCFLWDMVICVRKWLGVYINLPGKLIKIHQTHELKNCLQRSKACIIKAWDVSAGIEWRLTRQRGWESKLNKTITNLLVSFITGQITMMSIHLSVSVSTVRDCFSFQLFLLWGLSTFSQVKS